MPLLPRRTSWRFFSFPDFLFGVPMKHLFLLFACACTVASFAQTVVWDNMDACSGDWSQSSLIGAKKSFQAARFETVGPRSAEGGCYLSYATADTFHANSTIGWFAQQKMQAWTQRYVNMLVFSRD